MSEGILYKAVMEAGRVSESKAESIVNAVSDWFRDEAVKAAMLAFKMESPVAHHYFVSAAFNHASDVLDNEFGVTSDE